MASTGAGSEGAETTVSLTPPSQQGTTMTMTSRRESVGEVVREMVDAGFGHDGGKLYSSTTTTSLVERAQWAVHDKGPRLKRALAFSTQDVLHWMHQGGPWRALLLTTVGIIGLIALTGLAVFAAFLLTATANATAVGFLMSVAAVGAFMALFFTALTGIYVGALTASAVAVGTVGFLSSCAVLFLSGWIASAWLVWQGVRQILQLVRGSLCVVGTALTTLSAAGRTQVITFEKRPAVIAAPDAFVAQLQ